MQINSAKDLKVYKAAYELAMRVFEVTKKFPPEERYALTSQISSIFTFGLYEFARSLGEAKVRGTFHKQAVRLRR